MKRDSGTRQMFTSGQASDAEDLVQQTFLVAQQKLHQLREADRAFVEEAYHRVWLGFV